MPSVTDFLRYGPIGAYESDALRRRRREDRERALDLAEKQALAGSATGSGARVDDAGLMRDLGPALDFGPRDELELSLALGDIGLDEKKLAEAREQQARTRTFLDLAGRLQGGDATPATARAADFTNKKTLAPVGMQGGVAFDRFDPGAPILDESSAVTQLAAQRRATADLTRQRGDSLRTVLADPTLSQPVRADIANQRAIYKPQRVKVRRADGDVYMDAVPSLAGGYEYRPAADATGEALRPPAGAGARGTALQTDTAFIAETLNIPPEQAILKKLNSKTKDAQTLWEETVRDVARSDTYGRLNAQQRLGKARELWAQMRPGELPPIDAPAAPAASSVLDTDDEDAAFDAERASQGYDSPDAVKAAYEAGELEYDEAIALLQSMGFE